MHGAHAAPARTVPDVTDSIPGVLRLPNGDVYKGNFSFGVYDGQGTLTYAKPQPDGRTEVRGVWRYGRLTDARNEQQARENVEAALYSQRTLLDKSIASLSARDVGPSCGKCW